MPEMETVWIIGASEGIGAAVARLWSRRGVRLILSARSADRLHDLAAEIGAHHIVLPMDVSDRASIEAAATRIKAIGPLDRVVNLAGVYDPGKIADADSERAAQIVNVNLLGSFHIAQIAPRLMRDGGQLALCGSVAGYIGLPQGQIYSATKAAVINLAESLRAEMHPRIDVRLICPGFVDTNMTRQNNFDMPAMIPPEKAARAIVDGLHGHGFEVHFPKRLTLALKLIRGLPYWVSLPLTRRLVR